MEVILYCVNDSIHSYYWHFQVIIKWFHNNRNVSSGVSYQDHCRYEVEHTWILLKTLAHTFIL